MSINLPTVVAAIDETLAQLQRLRAELVALNNRPPEQPTRGTIEFQGAVIPLPDDSTSWERHDDPEVD